MKLFITALAFLLSLSMFGQELQSGYSMQKNAVYGNVGFFGAYNVIGFSATSVNINFERNIKILSSDMFNTYAKASLGYLNLNLSLGFPELDFNDAETYASTAIGFLSHPHNKHHMDLGLGITKQIWNDDLIPYFNIGWRRSSALDSQIIRAGMGIPDLFYFGYGFSF
jgi:hypothetical protein